MFEYFIKNLDHISFDNRHMVYTRMDFFYKIISYYFNSQDRVIVETIIHKSINEGERLDIPYHFVLWDIVKYLNNPSNENPQVNFLNSQELDFLINSSYIFINLLNYLIVGNFQIDRKIPECWITEAQNKATRVLQMHLQTNWEGGSEK